MFENRVLTLSCGAAAEAEEGSQLSPCYPFRAPVQGDRACTRVPVMPPLKYGLESREEAPEMPPWQDNWASWEALVTLL